MGDLELVVYSKGLERFSIASITNAIAKLSTAKLKEYESRIPALGDLIQIVRIEERKLNPWLPCGDCVSGFRIVEEDSPHQAVRCQCWLEWKLKDNAG
jgi:hypothetical protein